MIKVEINKIMFELNKNKLTTILGSNCSGKSILAKTLNKKLDDSILVNENTKLHILDNLEISNNLKTLKKDLKIDEIIKQNQHSCGQKAILNIYASLLINKPIIIFDDIFNSIDNLNKEKIFKYLKKMSKQKTIINITNNIDETIYGDYVMLIDNEKIILNEKTKDALTKEKEFKNCNLDLPFMASLSLKLKYYDLVDSLYLDMNKLVDKLWK